MTFVIILCAIPSRPLLSKDCFTQYRIIGQKDGLSASKVVSITKDSIGTLWCGTMKGLDRIYGNMVIHYDQPEFSNKEIRFTFTDKTGLVWAGIFGGLYCYDGMNDSFVEAVTENRTLHPISYDMDDDGIMFYTEEGFFRYTYCDRKLDIMNMDLDSGNRYSHFCLSDSSKAIATKDSDGIYSIDFCSGEMTRIYSLDNNVNDLIIDSYGRIWIAIYNTGLMCFSPDCRETIGFYPQKGGFLQGYIPVSLYEHDGLLHILTDGGGIRTIDMESLETSDLNSIIQDNIPEEARYATTMLIDKDETWIGTIHHGLVRIKPSRMKYMNASDLGFGKEHGPNGSIISCFEEDSHGKIWIGTDGAGISIYDPETDFCTPLQVLERECITSIARNGDKMLVAVYSKGLYSCTDNGDIRQINLNGKETDDGAFAQDVVIKLHRQSDSRILISARDIYSLDTRKGKIQKYGLSGAANFKIAVYPEYTFAYNPFEIYRIDNITGNAECILTSNEGEISTVRLAWNALWVLRSYSLYRISMEDHSARQVAFRYNGEILSMETDRNGNLWLTTREKILYMKDPESYTVFSDDFRPNEFKSDATFCSSGNDLWFGGYSGLYSIKAEEHYKEASEDYSITLLSVFVNGKRNGCSSVQKDGKAPVVITIPDNYSSLDLCFCSVGEDALKASRFRYTITGKEKQSVIFSGNRLSLPLLTPGTYSISVASTDKKDSWTEHSDILSIRVTPPQKYSKIFFCIAVILIIGAVSAAGFRHRKHRKAKEGSPKKEVTDEFMENHQSPESLICQEDMFMSEIDRFIEENIGNYSLDAQMLIDHMCIGRASFYKKVKDETGSGIMKYVTKKRMQAAAELLKNSELSITEIALKVGYIDNQYFSRAFKQHLGSSPSSYRKEHADPIPSRLS